MSTLSLPCAALLALALAAAASGCEGEAGAGAPPATPAAAPAREVAWTFDDVPVSSVVWRDAASHERITADLLAAIGRNRIPAIGFVNEEKLAPGGGAPEPARTALLERWLEAGLELGNHTYSHADLHYTPLPDYEADVLRGEVVLRPLAEARGSRLRFFRHPYLHTGSDLGTKRRLEAFLAEHGYRVAPVSIDNYDYVFATAYDRAAARGDSAAQARIAAEYLGYMERVVRYYEQQSAALVGREIRQVLLLHANALNAATLDSLAAMLARRGYAFVPLERALEDPAYASRDEYVGPAGITWLHRWALTAGKRGAVFAGEPEVPAWVTRAAAEP